ncbi:hypothetical protein HMPREF1984_01555 [Leptotrichia sp. oral taxon 215 str. W9775]|nr:hypothetical protein HMPREF1984_01555 [Leptotrichia sp. oral taxon 215 str. W9775]
MFTLFKNLKNNIFIPFIIYTSKNLLLQFYLYFIINSLSALSIKDKLCDDMINVVFFLIFSTISIIFFSVL